MKRNLFLTMCIFAITAGCGTKKVDSTYPSDTVIAANGDKITLTFFHHASIAVGWNGKNIYLDPVSAFANYGALPKADLILVTHSHSDHFDATAINSLSTATTKVITDATTAEQAAASYTIMRPSDTLEPIEGIKIEAVKAYNTSEGHLQFHPERRNDCGYVLTIGGTRIYVAGDTEDTAEVLAMRDIDILFLPVNQPYTMTVEQTVRAVKAIRPKIFYPYHYGEVEQKTDIERLKNELQGTCEVRIRPLE